MGQRLDETALDTLFREARTYTRWQPRLPRLPFSEAYSVL